MPAYPLAARLMWQWQQSPPTWGCFSQVVGGFVSEASTLGWQFLLSRRETETVQFMFCWRWLSFFLLLSFAHCLPSCLDRIQCLMSCNGMELLSLGFSLCSSLKCLPGKPSALTKSLDQQGSTDNCWGQPVLEPCGKSLLSCLASLDHRKILRNGDFV